MGDRNLIIGGRSLRPGSRTNLNLKVSETYLGQTLRLPLRVLRAHESGPVVSITAAIHGDEINGCGIIHELLHDRSLKLKRGTVIFVPVINVFGFENHDRYLPDRRDLNRSFPGSANGTLAARMANLIMEEIVSHCDYGIDLHTAAIQRTNFPNVRGDLSNREILRMAKAFGCELIINGKGPEGSLRREACKAGCPTIILEAGEPWKFEPSVVAVGVRGVRNILIDFGMIEGSRYKPPYQTRAKTLRWIRAEVGGLLRFHVSPGETVLEGQPIATNYGILGTRQNQLTSPFDGLVLSMTTLPMVKPGEPVCHIAQTTKSVKKIREALEGSTRKNLHHRLRTDLATNIRVEIPPEEVAANSQRSHGNI